jgi:hypothetical protein
VERADPHAIGIRLLPQKGKHDALETLITLLEALIERLKQLPGTQATGAAKNLAPPPTDRWRNALAADAFFARQASGGSYETEREDDKSSKGRDSADDLLAMLFADE